MAVRIASPSRRAAPVMLLAAAVLVPLHSSGGDHVAAPPAPSTAPPPLADGPAPAPALAPQPPPAQLPDPVPDPVPEPAPDPVLEAVPAAGHVPVATGALAVAPGASEVVGEGPPRRLLVEVEDGTGVDPAAFARAVEGVLFDTRSWSGDGSVALQRVDAEPVDFRVTLAHPDTVDRHCRPLRTNGRYSCWNGSRAMLNLDNWVHAVPAYGQDVGGYRRYLVNHEVGHALGHGHVGCPDAGQPAPVMMQQTKGVGACIPNPWPFS